MHILIEDGKFFIVCTGKARRRAAVRRHFADDVVQAVPLRERDPGRDVFSARNEFFARMYALYDLFTRLFAAGCLADDEKLLSVL